MSGRTSDIPVAEEAAVTAEVMVKPGEAPVRCGGGWDTPGSLSTTWTSSTMPGHHRWAGMECGAWPAVGGLTDKPVVAVPTSIGYGANLAAFQPSTC